MRLIRGRVVETVSTDRWKFRLEFPLTHRKLAVRRVSGSGSDTVPGQLKEASTWSSTSRRNG